MSLISVTLACCQRAMLCMYFDAPSASSVITGKIAHVCWTHCVQRAASLRVFCESTLSNSHSDAVMMERSFISGASANFATAHTAMPCATARRSRLLLCSSLMLGNCRITVSMVVLEEPGFAGPLFLWSPWRSKLLQPLHRQQLLLRKPRSRFWRPRSQ